MAHGYAHAVTSKDEDTHAVLHSAGTSLFAIYDGHGGKQAAEHCREKLSPALIALAPDFEEAAIADAFWAADASLGKDNVLDGTTATVLLVSHGGDGSATSKARCVLAWVGDSSALVVDMLAPGHHKAAVSHTTSDHHVKSPSEVARLEQEWAVRKHLRVSNRSPSVVTASRDTSKSQLSGETSRSSVDGVTLSEAREASIALGMDLSDAQVRMLHRALAREQTIVRHERRSGLRRASTTLGSRFANNMGPMALIAGHRVTAQDGASPAAMAAMAAAAPKAWPVSSAPVSTCVTRSIGDWDASRACVPQPDAVRFDVPADGFVRVVLASDGLWDFVSHADAARLLRTSATAQRAAEQLVSLAKNRSVQRIGRLKDDTTVIVATVNPGALDSWPAIESRSSHFGSSLFGCCRGGAVTQVVVEPAAPLPTVA